MITITDAITIAIITISPGPNAYTYAHNLGEAGSRFRWKIWFGDLLSPRSDCLLFLQNPMLQLLTSWPWGIVRSRRGGCTKNKVQTMISTDVMILGTATPFCHPPPASWCLAPATEQVPGSSTQEHTWEHIVKSDWECLESSECTWERVRECARECASVPLESLLGSVQSSRLGVYHRVQLGSSLRACPGVCLGTYSELYSGVYWECTWERPGVYLGAYSHASWECHRVQLGVYLRVCSGVCLETPWQLTWKRTVKQVGSVPLGAIGSILDSMPGSVLENVLRGALLSVQWSAFGSLVSCWMQHDVWYQAHIIACNS